ncbi:unnamed protein product [Lactuca virosa]|uniref:Uncharacterized protein n=1 Tax=Lactuca virosa TaxID=75947 RepID=A0AAU9PNR2_9ASTR|nr:unnamed protein product [Lactuca virosa]
MENKIMDKLAVKTEKVKDLSIHLENANKKLDALKSENVVIKSCIADVNLFLQNLVETRDSLLTVSVRQHLADKLKPVFSLMNHIKGVSESGSLPKQGGEAKKPSTEELNKLAANSGEYEHKTQLKSQDPKGNEASGSKGKGKLIDDDEEEEELSEGAKLKRKKRDKELDEAQWVAKESEALEREAREAQVTLKTQKALFPSLFLLGFMYSNIPMVHIQP